MTIKLVLVHAHQDNSQPMVSAKLVKIISTISQIVSNNALLVLMSKTKLVANALFSALYVRMKLLAPFAQKAIT